MSNLLSEVHPELIAEWSDKNLPLTPDKVPFGSNKIMWWKGKCGHEWQTGIKARSNGEGCPICSGARAVEGINDLTTLRPELAKEWSKKNNDLKPTMVTLERESNREILNTAPIPYNKEEIKPDTTSEYEYHLGDAVYIGSEKYEILSFDNERVKPRAG